MTKFNVSNHYFDSGINQQLRKTVQSAYDTGHVDGMIEGMHRALALCKIAAQPPGTEISLLDVMDDIENSLESTSLEEIQSPSEAIKVAPETIRGCARVRAHMRV